MCLKYRPKIGEITFHPLYDTDQLSRILTNPEKSHCANRNLHKEKVEIF